MATNKCPQCGAPIDPTATECKFCGEKLAVQQAAQQMQPQFGYAQQPQSQFGYAQQPQIIIQQGSPQPQPMYMTGINPAWPLKDKTVAALLAIFLGGIGVHKFYLGHTVAGIIYICFCWTGIPEVLGVIEGIIYLASNSENFQLKHHVRLQ